jgi:predicted RND superfamily exporter protein
MLHRVQRLTRLSLAHPRSTLALLAAVTLFFAAGALRVETDVGYRALLGHDHPTVARFDSFVSRYDGGFPLAALYRCGESPRCASVFDPAAVAMAADVAARVAHAPGVRRVESVATTPLWVPDGDEPVARRLADAPAAELPALGERALHDSLWPRALVSEDGRAAVIALEVASSEGQDNVAAYAALEAALAPYEARGWTFHRAGGPVEFVVAGAELQADTARLVPVMIALVGLVLFVLFRSLAAAVATLATVGVAVLWSFGAMGWLGLAQNSITQALPPLMLVICVCDGIHVMALYAAEGRADPGATRAALLQRTVADVGAPCVFTAATTAGGFASFVTSDLRSLAEFGAISAFGVMIALVLTFTLLPILALRIPPASVRAADATRRWEGWMERAVRSAGAHPGKILATAAAVGLLAALGLPQLRIDARFEDLYGEDSRVVRWVYAFRESLRRPDTLEVELIAPAAAAADDPKVMQTVEHTAAALAAIDGLGPARSLPDALALANQLGNQDDPFWRRVPGNQLDLRDLFEAMQQRDGGEIARYADLDGHRYRISLEAEKPPQEEMRRIFREVDARLAATLPEGWNAELTGPLTVVHEMVDEIQDSQVGSFAAATALVLTLIAIFQRSVWAALLAAVPTLLPVLVTLGLLGFAGISLDIGGTMVAAVVIGIADDDAVHLLDQYRRRRRAGQPPAEAIDGALLHVGRALVTTSVALAVGFLALTVSAWQTIASFGLIAALAITVALVAALFVLPACVLAWERVRARVRSAA